MSLTELFDNHTGHVVHKHRIHLEAYEFVFKKFRGEKVGILEIGLGNGGSLELWRKYFGKDASIFGLDVVDLKYLESESDSKIFIGTQADQKLLRDIAGAMDSLNFVIDDGSHFSKDQILSFEALFPLLADGGFYIVEDTHTSYRDAYGGGLGKPGTFIEYLKLMVDNLQRSEFSFSEGQFQSLCWDHVFSVSFYPNLAIIEKRHSGSWGGAEMRGRQ